MQIAEYAAANPTMRIEEIADAFRVCQGTVTKACQEFSVKKPYAALPDRWPSSINWGVVDWSQRDTDIARETGLTRERVRQKRKALNKPKAVHYHKRTKVVELRRWMASSGQQLNGLLLTDAMAVCPIKVNRTTFADTAKFSGIRIAPPLNGCAKRF